MSRTLNISDELYERLESEARRRGLKSVEELLRDLPLPEVDLASRVEVVRGIDELREQLFSRYGLMPDSVESLREDRAR